MAVIQLSVCLDPLFLTLQLKYDTSTFYRFYISAYTTQLVKISAALNGNIYLEWMLQEVLYLYKIHIVPRDL